MNSVNINTFPLIHYSDLIWSMLFHFIYYKMYSFRHILNKKNPKSFKQANTFIYSDSSPNSIKFMMSTILRKASTYCLLPSLFFFFGLILYNGCWRYSRACYKALGSLVFILIYHIKYPCKYVCIDNYVSTNIPTTYSDYFIKVVSTDQQIV